MRCVVSSPTVNDRLMTRLRRLAGVPVTIRLGLEALVIAGDERAVLAAGIGIGVNLETSLEIDLVDVDGVVAALTSMRRLHKDLVGELLLGSQGYAPRAQDRDHHQQCSQTHHLRRLLPRPTVFASRGARASLATERNEQLECHEARGMKTEPYIRDD